MATLVLGAIGGALLGNWGAVAGIWLGSILFPQRLPDQEQGRMDDLKVTSSAYGVMLPIIFGTVRIAGNIIWATDLEEHESSHRVGGKKSQVTIKEYTYSVNMAVAVAEGPITRINKIWAEDIVIYENIGGVDQTDYTMRVYLGDETQTADPLIVGIEGAGNTPAYRGLAYVAFEDLDLTPWGGRIPNLNFEVCNLEQAI